MQRTCNCPPPWDQVLRAPLGRDLGPDDLCPCARGLVPTWAQANAECWKNTRRVLATYLQHGNPGPLLVRSERFRHAYVASTVWAQPGICHAQLKPPVEIQWQTWILTSRPVTFQVRRSGRRGRASTIVTEQLTYPAEWPLWVATAWRMPGGTPHNIRIGPWHNTADANGQVHVRSATLALGPATTVAAGRAEFQLTPGAKATHACGTGVRWTRPELIEYTVYEMYRVAEDGRIEATPARGLVFVEMELDGRHPRIVAVKQGKRLVRPVRQFVSEVVAS